MPSLYLDKTDRDRQIADALAKMDPFVRWKEAERVLVVSSDGIIRVNRRRLEDLLGGPLSDDEWRSKFRRFVGQAEYDDRQFTLSEEPPGDA